MESVNLTQMTIISTTVGKNPLEEMEYVCQGQKLVGPHARRVAAKRRYPASEVEWVTMPSS